MHFGKESEENGEYGRLSVEVDPKLSKLGGAGLIGSLSTISWESFHLEGSRTLDGHNERTTFAPPPLLALCCAGAVALCFCFFFFLFCVFFFNDTATTEIYTLSLHDALPISLSTKDSLISD